MYVYIYMYIYIYTYICTYIYIHIHECILFFGAIHCSANTSSIILRLGAANQPPCWQSLAWFITARPAPHHERPLRGTRSPCLPPN